MKLPVAPELFDLLTNYAKEIEKGKIKPTPTLGSTSPALTFCENFYAQFFQNALKKEIIQFNLEAAVRLRLEIEDEHGSPAILQLVYWYEKLCDIYPNVLQLGYSVGTKTTFVDFNNDYLLKLLERASKWAAEENYPAIEQKAQKALKELRKALQALAK
jgi:hypothetical protein